MDKPKRTLEKNLPYIFIVCALIIGVAALILSIDHDRLLANPKSSLNCNLDPVISCGNIISSKQGKAFGFPNPYIGLFASGILFTIGFAQLAGARFKRWFWLGLEAGTLFGIGFIGWLFFESLYRIHNLCPYCMTVWVATITAFWYVSFSNIDRKIIVLPSVLKRPYKWLRRHHADILVLIFILIAAFILHHFWYYYGKHL